LARHVAAVMLRVAHRAVAAAGLADAVVALRNGMGAASAADPEQSIFHDDQIDGPLPPRVRTFVLATDTERAVVAARVAGLGGVDVIHAEDVPEALDVSDIERIPPVAAGRGPGRLEEQLAMLAVRMEMTAVYLKLVRG
jgi:hypothetical protein